MTACASFVDARVKLKRCKRCNKRWCGTGRQLDKLYPQDAPHREVTYGTMRCREKGPKR